MNKEVFNNIYQSYMQKRLLCPEVLFQIVDEEFDHNEEIILLASNRLMVEGDDQDFIPTLSLIKKEGRNTCLIQTHEFLWNYLKTQAGIERSKCRSIKHVVEFSQTLGYRKYFFEDLRVVLLVKGAPRQENLYCQISKSLDYVIQRSQNLKNDSRRLADQDKDDLKKLFSPVLKEAATIFANFCSDNYGVNAQTFHILSKENKYVCSSNNCSSLMNEILNEKGDQLKSEQKPLTCFDSGHFYLLFPFLSPLVRRDFRSVIVIESEEPIPEFISDNLTYFSNYYFAVYLEKEKNRTLENLKLKVIEANKSIIETIDKGIPLNVGEALKDFCKNAFADIVNYTNAISATLRLYNPDTESLDIILNHSSELAEKKYDSTQCEIKIIDYRKSVVAETYRSATPDSLPTHIKDLAEYRRRKYPYLELRKNALSELCYAIFFGQIKIGTINFESNIKKGFVNEIDEFFSKFRNTLEAYVKAIYDANDKHWLTRRSAVYQNIHEIKNMAYADQVPESFRSAISRYINFNENVESSTEKELLTVLEQKITALMPIYFRDIDSSVPAIVSQDIKKDLASRVFIKLDAIKDFAEYSILKYRISLIVILVKNVLDNYRKRNTESRGKDHVHISLTNDCKMLIIRSVSHQMLSEEFKSKMLKEPFTTEAIKGKPKAHYGAFIIGVIARHLNGYAQIKEDRKLGRSTILISVPTDIRGTDHE